MYKKIFFCVFVFVWVFPPAVLAALVPPFLNFTINQTVAGQDVNFNFSIKGYAPALYYTEDFAIQTANGAGSYTSSTFTGSGDSYYITQSPVAGLPLKEIICSSDNPSIIFNYLPDGVRFNAYGYSSVECSFKNISEQEKTPLLIIPGTLGTEILKDGEKLWVNLEKMQNPLNSDSFMDPLAFNSNAVPSDANLYLGGVIDKIDDKFNYTNKLVEGLKDFKFNKDQNLFLLPYDWRDFIEINANTVLKQKIDDILTLTQSSKLDIVAHSQGGLLIKKLLLDKPEYQNKINKLIFVGTPNLGTPKSAKTLFYGDDLDVSFLGVGLLNSDEIKKIVKNMPAIYQMLPSSEYFNHSEGYAGQYKYNGVFSSGKIVSNFQDTKELLKTPYYNLNSSLIDKADEFHSAELDNLDFTNTGIKTYNIMGCQSPTVGKIYINGIGNNRDITYEPGDGTVPLVSASNIPGAQNFYVLNNNKIHGTMLTTEGVRQKIMSIILDQQIPGYSGVVVSNPALCVFEGTKVEVHSPVELNIYDQYGNHVGPNPDGTFDHQIESVAYDTIGHSKYAFLPNNAQDFKIKLNATDAGSFSFYASKIFADNILSTSYYSNIPIASTSTAEVTLNELNNQPIIFTSDSRVIEPSSVLINNEALDSVSPISTSTISGLMGEVGSFRGDVVVTLSAEDVLVAGKENETSGILGIKYSLDGGEYLSYSVSSPINITTEGEHKIKFFATDRAGNNEQEQEINFVIDKTPPEFVISFDSNIKDLVFSATDTLQTTLNTSTLTSSFKKLSKIKDQGQKITATDAAGNVTILTLTEKDRKKSARAEIKSLNYNGVEANIKNVNLAFWWQINKAQKLTELHQIIKNKKEFTVYAYYKNGLTKILGKDQNGVINKTVNGITTLNVSTNKGDINWSFNK